MFENENQHPNLNIEQPPSNQEMSSHPPEADAIPMKIIDSTNDDRSPAQVEVE